MNYSASLKIGRRNPSMSSLRCLCTRASTQVQSAAKEEPLYSTEKKTHFGYQTISEDSKAKRVKTVFENVADQYDLMNDVMSAGVHGVWKDIFVHRMRPKCKTKLIDVAGGTGDIAFRFLKYKTVNSIPFRAPDFTSFPFQHGLPLADRIPQNEVEAHYQVMEQAKTNQSQTREPNDQSINANNAEESRSVLVCDINSKMIEVGQKRASSFLTPVQQNQISWCEADAENMSSVPSNSFDVYTIAFGIRNCVHIDRVLSEAFRVLRPGGRFMCLEFSHVPNSVLKWAYDQYSFQVIPVMGQIVAGDWDSYLYLVESIRKFPDQEKFKRMIQRAGFKFARYENLTFGVAAIHCGVKL